MFHVQIFERNITRVKNSTRVFGILLVTVHMQMSLERLSNCPIERSYSCDIFLEIRASRSLEPKRVLPQPCRRAAKTRRPRRVVNWQDGLEPRGRSRESNASGWRVHVTRSHFSFVGINSYTRKGIQPRLSFFPWFCLPWRSAVHSQHVHQARGTRRTWSRRL